ncbi:MAG: hypothetical protein J2P39_09565 [Candidatus Dormibacteraeota bacterium]|nr:hypothetical protein [Candidatus Dormibacteraeota bacterium]
MTGWNLPPGCNVSDIPGNRPEDEAEELFWDELIDRAAGLDLPEGWYESADHPVAKLVEIVRQMAWKHGFEDGRQEAQIDETLRLMEEEEAHEGE